MATPEQIAAAWGAWRVRHKGSMGPGPGFVEAIDAALAVSPDPRIAALEAQVQALRKALEPFAKLSGNYTSFGPFDVVWAKGCVYVSDLHRARLASERNGE